MRLTMRVILSLFLISLALSSASKADAPNVISYQGRVTDAGGTPLNGPTSLRFRLYTAPIGGVLLYDSGPQVIGVTDGLFSVELGKAPFTSLFVNPLFSDTSVYLGVTVGGDPEISPRTRVTTSGYASHVQTIDGADGGTIRNNLFVQNTILSGEAVSLDGNTAQINTFGSDGLEQIRLWGPSWGELLLFDASPSNLLTTYLGSSFGGQMTLYDGFGLVTHQFLSSFGGDFSTVLPPDAVNSTELLNEPGITNEEAFGFATLSSSSMTDLLVTTITIPEAGYIVLDGRGYGYSSGTTGVNLYEMQIDELAGGGLEFGYFTAWGTEFAASATTSYYLPVTTRRVYFKGAGTWTFRLEAAADPGNTVGGIGGIGWYDLTALYIPTSYGSVATVNAITPDGAVSDVTAPTLSSASVKGSIGLIQTQKSDLRDLELQAARAKQEALKLELEVQKAKLEEAREKSGQTLTKATTDRK